MSLPCELIDEILGYLPLGDRKSLQAYSLVAKSWVSPARRRLFSLVVITEVNYWSWKANISPANTGLLSHIRSLWYITHWCTADGNPPINDFFDYLPSFYRLRHLSLCSTRIESDISQQLRVFSSFPHSLSSLALYNVILTWPALVAIVDYFPGVRDLKIKHPNWKIDQHQTPPLSRPLRGKLTIEMYEGHALRIFSDRLSGLEVEYDELLIFGVPEPKWSTIPLQGLINACGKTLKRLKLGPGVSSNPLTLRHCPRLSCLQTPITAPRQGERSIISSITSVNLRTITFLPDTQGFSSQTLADHPHDWVTLDDIACTLVDKLHALGHKHALGFEFQFVSAEFNAKLNFSGFLPKFRERGRVRILNTSNGKVLDLAVRFFAEYIVRRYLTWLPSEMCEAKGYLWLTEKHTEQGDLGMIGLGANKMAKQVRWELIPLVCMALWHFTTKTFIYILKPW